MRDKTFLIMAGGTGGHVFPALAVAQELMSKNDRVIWLGSQGGMEEGIVTKAGIPFFGIKVSGVRGKGVIKQLLSPFKILSALFQAIKVIRQVKPNAVLGMGGFASGPGGIAAKLIGIPLIIHEQNSIAGMTNKILAKMSTSVMTAFPNAFNEGIACKEVGNPLRSEITQLYFDPDQKKCKRETIHLLILGGSLGAQSLNEIVPKTLSMLAKDIIPSVRHQTGKNKAEPVKRAYLEAGIDADVTEFIENMAEAYKWADFVICRAGALTVSELCVAGLGSILIPYPHAVDDHQTKNAEFLVNGGAAWLLEQKNLNESVLSEILRPLLEKPERMSVLAEAAHKLARVDATESVANECRRVGYA